jgi:hypothetical protein
MSFQTQYNLYNQMANINPVNKYGKYTLGQLTNQELEDESKVDWGQAVGEEKICSLINLIPNAEDK